MRAEVSSDSPCRLSQCRIFGSLLGSRQTPRTRWIDFLAQIGRVGRGVEDGRDVSSEARMLDSQIDSQDDTNKTTTEDFGGTILAENTTIMDKRVHGWTSINLTFNPRVLGSSPSGITIQAELEIAPCKSPPAWRRRALVMHGMPRVAPLFPIKTSTMVREAPFC